MEESKILKIEFISRETIKPSSASPNPQQQETFKLSLLDQFHSNHLYVPTILFYKSTTSSPTSGDGRNGSKEVHEMSQRLKSSLSETLTRFYPFAGRLKDHLTIICNDEGVDYSEAHVLNCSLFDVLDKPNPKQLDPLIPEELEKSPELSTRPLVRIQVSFFQCGGMAIGVSVCHKVSDALTFCNFMTGWADSAIGNVINPTTPDFSASTLFPPTDSLPPIPQMSQNHNNRPTSSVRTARLVFGASELASLQAKATSIVNPRPSRFEAVTAFLTKNVMLSEKKPSQLIWAVNLRSKLQPPLPGNCFGNLVGIAVHEVGVVDGKDMPSLAGNLRRGSNDICDEFVEALKGGGETGVPGILELQMRKRNLFAKKDAGSIQLYRINSWCKLPFYGADFGWGKPFWVTNGGSHPMPHMIILMDTRDGNGMEAMVSLTEEEMTRFESNDELKNYAAFNPSAFS